MAKNIKKIKVGATTYDIYDATAARSSHTHSFDTITNRGEAFLSWGGKNFSGSYGPIDAAMVPELGANRLAFMPANAVTIEYSRDGGSTWKDYGPTDSQKVDLFNGRGASFTIGKATSGAGNIATNKYQLRVNIYTGAGQVYTALNKFVIYLSTSGTNGNWCTIRARTQSDYTAGNDKWTTFADKISVSGWSGYNVINTSGITTYGNTASTQYGHIQFIFGCDTGSTNNSYAGLNISKIFGFGGVGWTTPSTMAKTGQMYTYDSSQNVTFPAGVSAKSFTESGKTLSDTYIAKSVLTTKGDMIYASGRNTPARLTIGSTGQFLSVADGIPKWVNNPNTDTHYTNYLQIKGNGTEAVKFTQNTDKTLNLKPGTNVSISAASGEITISATDTNTHNSHAIISGTKSDGSTQIKGSASSGDITLGDSGVTAGAYGDTAAQTPGYNATFKVPSISVNAKGIVTAIGEHTVKIPASDNTNTSHSHSAGVGLVGSGSAGTSGTYTYKAKLRSETALTVDSAAATTTSGRVYPVAVDKSGYLSVNVPWTDTHHTSYLQIKGNGTEAVKFTQNANKSLNLKPSGSVSISAASGEITISATDTNTWRKVQLNGTDKLGTGTNTNPLNIKAGSNMTITESNGTFTFAATDTTYTFNGAVSTIKDNNLTASRVLISNSSGKVAVSDVTSTELSYLDGVTSSIQTQLNAKSDKTTYEWNKEFAAGSNGAISLGRYNIYDSQLTFDITSTTNQSLSGKLVIATQNGTIHQAKVFGDAAGELISKLIIYQSAISNSRSWVEVFCNFNGWSKNKVHIYAVALNSATVQKQMTSVTISNGVPAAANVTSGDTKWTGTIVNDFNHSHGISIKDIKDSSGASKLTLAHGTKYELTAGGQSFIFTTPSDNNTWRGIQDNLTSTSTTDSLSANQGRVLKGLVDSKVNSSDLVELTLTNNSTKRYLIGSYSATSWSDIGTNSSCYTQSGSLYATYFYGTSDRRLKENIKDLDLNCLDLVNNINLREFSWKADKEHKPTIGAVAQELRQVLPEKYVHEFIGGQETDDEYLSINDSKLVYLLIGAIQEQQKEIESLKAKIDGKTI